MLFSITHIQAQDITKRLSTNVLCIWTTALLKVNCMTCVLKANTFYTGSPSEHEHYKCPVQQQKKQNASYSKASYQIALERYSFRGHEF